MSSSMEVDDTVASSAGVSTTTDAVSMEEESTTKDDSSKAIPSGSGIVSEIGDTVMAATGTSASVSVSLHPLVILNVSEHWTRQKAQEQKSVQVLGALIGKQTGRHIEIMNSFELCYDTLDGLIVVNKDYYTLKESQYKQVFEDLDLLGWYTTGEAPTQADLMIHKQMCDLLDSPIFFKLNPMPRHSHLPVSIYESVIDLVNGTPTLLLVALQYTLATEEAERIGVDHVARMSAHDTHENSLVADNLQAQCSAIKMLANRVRLILEYVRASERGDLPFNHEILRQVNALSHRLPVLSSDNFKDEFHNQNNDVALMAYLGTMTKCCNTMNRYINRFNQLHESISMGRRLRGILF